MPEQSADVAPRRSRLGRSRAVDALGYAAWVASSAQLDVLDTIDARAYADERAKAAGLR
jgi:hypothetical protein